MINGGYLMRRLVSITRSVSVIFIPMYRIKKISLTLIGFALFGASCT